MFNTLRPNGDNRLLSVQSMHALLRAGGTGSEFVTSDFRLLMNNLALDPLQAQALRRRSQITSISMDLDRPSVIPYIWNANDNANPTSRFRLSAVAINTISQAPGTTNVLIDTTPVAHGFSNGQAIVISSTTQPVFNGTFQITSVPTPTTFTYMVTTASPGPGPFVGGAATPLQPKGGPTGGLAFPTLANRGATPLTGSEFDPNSWRSLLAQLSRLNLNRPLRAYPNLTPTPVGSNPTVTGSFDFTAANTQAQYLAAVQDRQQLAQDIFNALVKLAGAVDANTIRANPGGLYPLGVNSPEYLATRWLAQLAANIVDYIDEDDYMTPFHWDPGNLGPPNGSADFGWVFGVEMPRLTLNEAYAQLDNDNSDPQIHGGNPHAERPYRMNVWLELHNPLPAETFPLRHQHGNPNAQLQITMSGAPVPVYQIVLTNPNLFTRALKDPANVTGDPTFPAAIAAAGAVKAGTTVTITTTLPHTFTVGQQVVIAGVGVAGYNGPAIIDAVPSQTSFTYTTPPGALGPSGGGIVTPVPYSTVNTWGNNNAHHMVTPANGAYADATHRNAGFYVIGAQPPQGPGGRFSDAADNPNIPTFLASPLMSYPVPLFGVPPAAATMPSFDVVLQRLACPHLPPNPMPGTPGYNPNLPPNPYITTDLLEMTGTNNTATTQVWDSRRFGPTPSGPVPVITPRANRHSFGRLQPYAAGRPLVSQNPQGPPANPNNQPLHTFYRHNSQFNTQPAGIPPGDTLKTSFDWLTHPDRLLVSPMELMNVSGVRQHELTHYFMQDCTQTLSNYPSPHLVSWTMSDGRLHRFLEFATTGSFQNGYSLGGRVPGRININSLGPADKEIFRAIVNAQQGNTFYSGPTTDTTVVDPLFAAIIARRTPTGVPGPNDTPFLSLATGHSAGPDLVSTAARSVNNTLLRANATGQGINGQRMLEPNYPALTPPYPAGTLQGAMYHPYQRFELLNKIYNNFTVRSNVFAVWMTVGFFEVEDDTTIPVRLGAEIGRSENRHVRHRMFAIVDRTHLQMASTNLKPGVTIVVDDPGETINVQPNSVVKDLDGAAGILNAMAGTNTASNLHWTIQEGTTLTVNPNTNSEETVTVFRGLSQVTGQPALQARFFKNHGNAAALTNAAVIVRGNPGPHYRYNPRSDTNVVPYFAIID
jgi:hypothetical protein